MFIICIVSTYGKRREKGRKGYFIPLLPQRWTAFSKYHLITDFERFFSDHTFLIFIQLLNILQRKKSCLLKVYLLIISIITTALLPTKPPSPVPNCLLQVTFTSLILMPAGLSAALKTGFRANTSLTPPRQTLSQSPYLYLWSQNFIIQSRIPN